MHWSVYVVRKVEDDICIVVTEIFYDRPRERNDYSNLCQRRLINIWFIIN